MRKTYALIDCSHVCYAAYYSMPRLSHGNVETGVLYGFLKRILGVAKDLDTNRLIFCWDSPASIRKDHYPWYKEQRGKNKDKAMVELINEQKELLRNVILPLIGFTNSVMIEGYEADDTMAYLIESRPKSDFYIVANDADLFQIMKNKNCLGIYRLKDRDIYTVKDFKATYHGLPPVKWDRVKAIAGCSTDEVPGCPGVGEMTAVKYLTDNLPSRYKAFQTIESKEGREIEKRNKWLVHLPLPGLEDFGITIFKNKFSKKGFLKVCKMYHFASLENNRHVWYKMMRGQ